MTKRLISLLFLASGAAIEDEPPHAIPGKIYRSASQTIPPSAGPRVDHGIGACITADFICWTARMEHLSVVQTGISAGNIHANKGNTNYPDWRWKPGFKLGLGLALPRDGRDADADYTFLDSEAWNSNRENNQDLFPCRNIANLFPLIHTDTVQGAKATWRFHFNAIDLSFGRNYFIGKFLKMRPFIGCKGSRIDQDYHLNYDVVTTELDSNLRMKNKQKYWGIGLRTGLNTARHSTQTSSIYGNLALSGLWSRFEVDRKDSRNDSRNAAGPTNPPLDTLLTVVKTGDHFHTLKAIPEIGIGMRREWRSFEDRYRFLIQLGWEQQLWINHNRLIIFSPMQANQGDLMLQRLTVKARLDF
ncbi:MAG: Lpg1974 family pore-forming outer membrane protein [Chlamydiota bacterium]